MKDFDRFPHHGVRHHLERLQEEVLKRNPAMSVGSSGDGEITLKFANATAYARKYGIKSGWRLEICQDGAKSQTHCPPTICDVIEKLTPHLVPRATSKLHRRRHVTPPPTRSSQELATESLRHSGSSPTVFTRATYPASLRQPNALSTPDRDHARDLDIIVNFWRRQHRTGAGMWLHPDDERVLAGHPHPFNLDFPAGPYVGDILHAPIIILGANGGYDAERTPAEFAPDNAILDHLSCIASPSTSAWTVPSYYYDKANYGPLLADGRAALMNACAYRSTRINADVRRIAKLLPSVTAARAWLLERIIPLANKGTRLVVIKRPGLWNLPYYARESRGMVVDPAPVSPRMTGGARDSIKKRLARLGLVHDDF